jgi:hypothetical protein
MADVIVVLNAGSSSLKFSVFVARGDELEPDLGGNIEEIDTAPRFLAKDRAGHVRAEKSWGERDRLGHRAGRARAARPAGAAAPAAQPGSHPAAPRAGARATADRVLRHGLPRHKSRAGAAVRAARRAARRRRAPLSAGTRRRGRRRRLSTWWCSMVSTASIWWRWSSTGFPASGPVPRTSSSRSATSSQALCRRARRGHAGDPRLAVGASRTPGKADRLHRGR